MGYNPNDPGYRSGLDNMSRPANGDYGAWNAGRTARSQQQSFNTPLTPQWGSGSCGPTPSSAGSDAANAAFLLLVWWALKLTALIAFIAAWIAALATVAVVRAVLWSALQLRRCGHEKLTAFLSRWIAPPERWTAAAQGYVQRGGSAVVSVLLS